MHTLIIAEAGVNHNGNLEIAKRLIDVAAAAGVDFVKFQTYKTENLVSKTAQKAIYQKKNVNDGNNSQYEMLKKLELSEVMHVDLISYCTQKDIKFLSTGFDESSIDYLEKLDVELFKVPSGEITNKPYLKHIASKGKPVIISTGMSSISEIKDALEVLMSKGLPRELITVLHCNTEYPTPMEDVNLKAMLTIQKELNVKIGYSDHTLGIEVPIAAVALGANVIEKHFTLDRSMEGPDHLASLEPDELKQMVKAIRNVELALSGSGEKKPSESEQKNLAVARRSIVAAQKIKKGEILSSDNITVKRPGNGLSPMMWDEVIGRKAIKDFDEEEFIEI